MSYYTKKEALLEAEKWGLRDEVAYLMEHGFTPDEALREWDCDEPEFDGAGFMIEDRDI